jgi:hypothetical protein
VQLTGLDLEVERDEGEDEALEVREAQLVTHLEVLH